MSIHGDTSDIGDVPSYQQVSSDTMCCLSLELDFCEQVCILNLLGDSSFSPFLKIQPQTIKFNKIHIDSWGHIIYRTCPIVLPGLY